VNPHEPAARDKYGRSEYPKRSSSRNCPRLSAAIREEYGDGFVLFGVKSMRYAERVSRAKGGLVAAMLHAGTAMALTASAMVASAQTFTDVTTMAFGDLSDSAGGLVPTLFTGGVAVGDCDGDGLPDVYFTGSNHAALFRNLGNGTFADITVDAGILQSGAGQGTSGAAFADVDNDGDLDLYVSGLSMARHYLYINDGHCHFTEEAVPRGVAVNTGALGRSVSFGDYDRDGYLDVYVAEFQSDIVNPGVMPPVGHLFHNRGAAAPGYFDDVTASAGVAVDAVQGSQQGTFPFTARFADLDGDGWPDLAIISDFGESRLFWNDGDGHFTDGTAAAGVATDEHGMGAVTADLDGDGRLDLFVTSIFIDGLANATGNRLYRNDGQRRFSDVTSAAGVRNGMWGWGTDAFDYDNDGALDLIMTNGLHQSEGNRAYVRMDLGPIDITPFETDPVRVWHNDGVGAFSEVSQALGLVDPEVGQGIATFDYDNDGDLDVLIVHLGDPPKLFRNDGGNANHWVDIDLAARRSAPRGVGARVRVGLAGGAAIVREVSASSTYLAQNGTGRVHIGLGPGAPVIDSIRIEWPSGIVQTVPGPPIDTLQHFTEPEDSCAPDTACEPTPTREATPTRESTPTNTPSVTERPTSTATPLASAAPPSATAICAGDCDRDGQVSIADVVTMVAIALDQAPVSQCPAGDTDGSGAITIAEVIVAIAHALSGCR
jgi:hypothetical protein